MAASMCELQELFREALVHPSEAPRRANRALRSWVEAQRAAQHEPGDFLKVPPSTKARPPPSGGLPGSSPCSFCSAARSDRRYKTGPSDMT